jgi:type II secretory pathway pseudopilin PulG
MPELLVVVGIIGVLIAFLFPALASVLRSGRMTSSLNNLRQISTMMELYSRDNREAIVPSQFDYSGPQFTFKGKVRSGVPVTGDPHQGTWADILWTVSELGADVPDAAYRYDSPDADFYDTNPDWDANPFRSTQRNTRAVEAGSGPFPYGSGAMEVGDPGYVAANDFFNARPDASADPAGLGTWYAAGQIKAPTRSMYLVDSFAGEVIDPDDPAAWDVAGGTEQVDFRHNELALMLFLDGHTQQEAIWTDQANLESRQIRLRNLTTLGGP